MPRIVLAMSCCGSLKGTFSVKIAKILKICFYFYLFAENILLVYSSIWYTKNVKCQREVFLSGTKAFAFSSPTGPLGELSHSIKACYWLRFYRVMKRFLSPSQHFFTQFCLLYNLVAMKKNHVCQRKLCL